MQTLLVLLIVMLAAIYSVWRLLPGGVRQRLHRWLIRRPDPVSQRLALLTPEPGGHCADCGARARCPARARSPSGSMPESRR